jgi:hypothetical protein
MPRMNFCRTVHQKALRANQLLIEREQRLVYLENIIHAALDKVFYYEIEFI